MSRELSVDSPSKIATALAHTRISKIADIKTRVKKFALSRTFTKKQQDFRGANRHIFIQLVKIYISKVILSRPRKVYIF